MVTLQYISALVNQTILLPISKGAVKYSMSDSENEFDDWGKKGAPKRKAAISDDDASFAPEPSTMADSDVDSPAPPPKAPEPA